MPDLRLGADFEREDQDAMTTDDCEGFLEMPGARDPVETSKNAGTDMLERVARAIAENRWAAKGYAVWESLGQHDREQCFEEARTAVEAMFDPAEAMIDVGNEAVVEAKSAGYIWRVMIFEVQK